MAHRLPDSRLGGCSYAVLSLEHLRQISDPCCGLLVLLDRSVLHHLLPISRPGAIAGLGSFGHPCIRPLCRHRVPGHRRMTPKVQIFPRHVPVFEALPRC